MNNKLRPVSDSGARRFRVESICNTVIDNDRQNAFALFPVGQWDDETRAPSLSGLLRL